MTGTGSAQGQEGLGRDGMCETDTRGKVVQAEGKAEQRPGGWMPPSDGAGALLSQSLPHTQSLRWGREGSGFKQMKGSQVMLITLHFAPCLTGEQVGYSTPGLGFGPG